MMIAAAAYRGYSYNPIPIGLLALTGFSLGIFIIHDTRTRYSTTCFGPDLQPGSPTDCPKAISMNYAIGAAQLLLGYVECFSNV